MIKFIQYTIVFLVIGTTLYCAAIKDSYSTYNKEFTYIQKDEVSK